MEYTIQPNTDKRSDKSSGSYRTFLSLIGDNESSTSSSSESASHQQIVLKKQTDKTSFPVNSTPFDGKVPRRKLLLSPIATALPPVTEIRESLTKTTNDGKSGKQAFKKGLLAKRSDTGLSVVNRGAASVAPNKGKSENVIEKQALPKRPNEELDDAKALPVEPSRQGNVNDVNDSNLGPQKVVKRGENGTRKKNVDSNVPEKTNPPKSKSWKPNVRRKSHQRDKSNTNQQPILRKESPRKRQSNQQIGISATSKRMVIESEEMNWDAYSPPTEQTRSPIKSQKANATAPKTDTRIVSQQPPEKSNEELANISKGNSSKRKSRKSTPVHRNVRALQEIKKYQRSTEPLIAKLPFSRLVREIAQKISDQPLRFTGISLLALQEGCEAFLVHFLQQSYLLALHAKRVTLMPRDLKLMRVLSDI